MKSSFFLDDALKEFYSFRQLAEKAVAQVSDEEYFRQLDDESNSIAVIVKHLAGNLRSRWTDFLTTDGEKPDRDRDGEFVIESADTRASLEARWQEGWKAAIAALQSLSDEDLKREVRIRAEPHTVLRAINRNLNHLAYHTGQIALLAKHMAGQRWQTLSIPRNRSRLTAGKTTSPR
jgi:uncharacterized damage-inducible protein DinB